MTSCFMSSSMVELCVEPAEEVLDGDSNCGFGG